MPQIPLKVSKIKVQVVQNCANAFKLFKMFLMVINVFRLDKNQRIRTLNLTKGSPWRILSFNRWKELGPPCSNTKGHSAELMLSHTDPFLGQGCAEGCLRAIFLTYTMYVYITSSRLHE